MPVSARDTGTMPMAERDRGVVVVGPAHCRQKGRQRASGLSRTGLICLALPWPIRISPDGTFNHEAGIASWTRAMAGDWVW